MSDPIARVDLSQRDVLLSNDDTWCSSVLDKLNVMRDKNHLCDATLEVTSTDYQRKSWFPVHACVLAASSDLFSGLFSRHVAKRKVQLERFETDTVEACLNYMYGKDLHVPVTQIQALRDSAKRLGLRTLTLRCDEALEVLKIKQPSPIKSTNFCEVIDNGDKEGQSYATIDINQDKLFDFENEINTPEGINKSTKVAEETFHAVHSDLDSMETSAMHDSPNYAIGSSSLQYTIGSAYDKNIQESPKKEMKPVAECKSQTSPISKVPKVMVSIFSQPLDSNIDVSIKKEDSETSSSRNTKRFQEKKNVAKKRKIVASAEEMDLMQEVHLIGQTKSTATTEAKLSGTVYHVCKLCGKKFIKKKKWSEHQLNEHGRSFECQFCDQAFKLRHHWRIHEQRHTGEKNYKCYHCAFQAVTAAEVKYHEEMEHLDREYSCPVCDKVFYSRKSLDKHKDIHTKIYNCQYCEYYAKKKSNVSRHVLKVHFPEKLEILECPMCDKKYNFKVQLDQHLALKHGAKAAENFRKVRQVRDESFSDNEINELTTDSQSDKAGDEESDYEFEDSDLVCEDSGNHGESDESSQECENVGECDTPEVKLESSNIHGGSWVGAKEIDFEDI